ncbi:hypothetical protein [Leeuwenhoekiella sp. LLG6367-2.1]|uniref:hypothetical protein n=1 Tax=Leeuwenhoekiella sp. LLG6367-2.1 TaxID=3160833 RepID=UPI003866FA7D
MNYQNLIPGQKVFFKKENIPMELIARTDRYAVVVRNIDIEEDYELIYFEVERGAYYDTQEAFEAIKDFPVYSLLDFETETRAPSNLIFNPWDFWSKNDCVECLRELEKATHQLSTRNGEKLIIDWDRTSNIKSNV